MRKSDLKIAKKHTTARHYGGREGGSQGWGTRAMGPLRRSVQREEADSSVEDRQAGVGVGWMGFCQQLLGEGCVGEALRPEKLRRCE